MTVRPFNVYGPGPDRRRRDPRVHRGRARRPRPHDPRRRLADPRLVLRRRHGRAPCCSASSARRRSGRASTSATPRSAVTIFDLAQRIKRLTGCPGEIVFQPLDYADVELRIPNVEQGARAARLRGEGRARRRPREDDRVVPASRQLTYPPRAARRRRGGARRDRRGARDGPADDGAEGRGVRGAARAPPQERSTRSPSRPAPPRCIVAVLALGIGAGDEVLVPAYTFPATANVVALAGGRPVLVDVDPVTMNIDPDGCGAARDARGRRPCSPSISSAAPRASRSCPTCRCSRTPPARSARRTAAGRADRSALLACFSFHPRKIVTTGEGGAVTTERRELAERVRSLRHHGWSPSYAYDDMPAPAFNYRLSDVLARARHPAAPPPRRAARRARRASPPATRSGSRISTSCCPGPIAGDRHGWQAYVVQVDRRDEVMAALRAQGIQCQIGTYALHRLGAYRDQGAVPRRGRRLRAGARAAAPRPADGGRARPGGGGP